MYPLVPYVHGTDCVTPSLVGIPFPRVYGVVPAGNPGEHGTFPARTCP
jgi:hypothetical protein